MAFNREGFIKEASKKYSVKEINQELVKRGLEPIKEDGLLRRASNTLTDFGLGVIPTIGSAIYEGGRAAGIGGENRYFNNETQQVTENPLMSQSKLADVVQHPIATSAKNTAGLASWAVPVGGLGVAAKVANPLLKLGVKGAELGLSGAAMSSLQNVANQEGTIDPMKAISNSGSGAIGNIAMSALLGTVGKGTKYLGKVIPNDIQNIFNKAAREKGKMYEGVSKKLYGEKNLGYAQKNGLIPDFSVEPLVADNATVSKIKEKVAELSQTKAEQLDNVLLMGNPLAPKNSTLGILEEMIRNASPAQMAPAEKKQWISYISKIGKENNVEIKGLGIPGSNANFDTVSRIPVKALNDLKQQFSQIQQGNQFTKEIYSFLRENVEKYSNQPETVKAINQELATLKGINWNLTKADSQINKATIAKKFTQEGVDKAITKVEQEVPTSLKALLAAASMTGIPAGKAAVDAMVPGFGNVGMLSAPFLLYGILQKAAQNPAIKQKIMKSLAGAYGIGEKAYNPMGISMGEVLRQAATRIPSKNGY